MIMNIPCKSNPMPYYVGQPTYPDYSKLPLTFESIGSTSVWFRKDSTITGLAYNKKSANGQQTGWTTWSSYSQNTAISLSNGDSLSVSGNNGQLIGVQYPSINAFCFDGSGKIHAYGAISSLLDPSIVQNYTPICLGNFFAGDGSDSVLQDLSRIVFYNPPYTNKRGFQGFCYSRKGLLRAPVIPYTSNMTGVAFDQMFNNCSNLSCIENCEPSQVSHSNWLNNVASSGIYIKPSTYTATSRDGNFIPSNWTILDRKLDTATGKKLLFLQGTDTLYTGEDPYPWRQYE